MICTSICHLASRTDHAYGVRTINPEECGPFRRSPEIYPLSSPAHIYFNITND